MPRRNHRKRRCVACGRLTRRVKCGGCVEAALVPKPIPPSRLYELYACELVLAGKRGAMILDRPDRARALLKELQA